jgi:aspartate kinase
MVKALAPLKELSPRLLDAIAATGELASSRLMAAALAEAGVPAVWVDSRQVVVTDAEHTAATPDMEATCARSQQRISPLVERGNVPVLGGFIAATSEE